MRAAPAKVCCIRLLLWLLPPAGIKSCAASKQAAAAAACRSEFACIAAASSVCLQDAQLGSVCSCAHQCKQSDLCTARQCAAVRLWHLQQPTQLEMPLLLLADCCCPAAFSLLVFILRLPASSPFPLQGRCPPSHERRRPARRRTEALARWQCRRQHGRAAEAREAAGGPCSAA